VQVAGLRSILRVPAGPFVPASTTTNLSDGAPTTCAFGRTSVLMGEVYAVRVLDALAAAEGAAPSIRDHDGRTLLDGVKRRRSLRHRLHGQVVILSWLYEVPSWAHSLAKCSICLMTRSMASGLWSGG
jgi:hypothetical protein